MHVVLGLEQTVTFSHVSYVINTDAYSTNV